MKSRERHGWGAAATNKYGAALLRAASEKEKKKNPTKVKVEKGVEFVI